MNVHQRIKERRLASGLTLLQVANKLNVQEATAQRYESGDIKNIKHDTIVALAEILKCSPSYLMGWESADYQFVMPKPLMVAETTATYHSASEEKRLVDSYRLLNDAGKAKAIEYLDDLAALEKYKAES
ncbi:MAG: helix-turn-helix domain-containing protein [Clostridiales bacterium]|nr:helix-turn-helix domain-containing protein [Clostridiales bacterium]